MKKRSLTPYGAGEFFSFESFVNRKLFCHNFFCENYFKKGSDLFAPLRLFLFKKTLLGGRFAQKRKLTLQKFYTQRVQEEVPAECSPP